MDPGLDAARAKLRVEQAPALDSESPPRDEPPVTKRALAFFELLTESVRDPRTGRLRRGKFTYDPALEGQRIAHGKALIRRVEPGPQEHADYFAMLALQAASIELAAADAAPGMFSKYLLGTEHASEVNAFSHRMSTDGYVIVVLNSGLVDFAYQAAKVVVEATRPTWTGEGERGSVKSLARLDDIREHLRTKKAPVDRLYRTLEAYFFHGYPRASTVKFLPPAEQHAPLSLLVGLAERFMIGHEYGHGTIPPMNDAPPEANLRRTEEHLADTQGMIWTVLSAAKFDGVPPEYPLGGGALFVLTCFDVRRRALSLLLTGDEHSMAAETETHPAPSNRAHAVMSAFRQFFDVKYSDQGFDLRLAPKKELPTTHGLTEDRTAFCRLYAATLEHVWSLTKDQLLEDRRRGRPLHAMWQ